MIPIPKLTPHCALCGQQENPGVFMVAAGETAVCEKCIDHASEIIIKARQECASKSANAGEGGNPLHSARKDQFPLAPFPGIDL